MSLRPVVVIEPHADDAFLSLGAHIERWVARGREVHIVTVFGPSRRSGEAQEYATQVGAVGSQLELPTAKVGITHQAPPLLVTVEQVRSAVQAVLHSNCPVIILPLGLRHPEHQVVVAALASPYVTYYMEIPYCLTLKDQLLLQKILAHRTIVSVEHPTRRKARHAVIFRSQAKFFFYNPPEKWGRAMELIVGPVPEKTVD